MLEATYAHYLNTIHSQSFVTRTTFVLMGIFNIVGKVITGSILDKSNEAPVICSLVGNALMMLPYLTLGTMRNWNIEGYHQQWVIMGGSPLLTCGFVTVFISTFLRMYHIKLVNINKEDTSTLISGERSICICPRCKNIKKYHLQECGILPNVWECF